MKYDLAIIGAGPGGADTAELAARRGLKVVLFEKNKVGGVCLNEGCIPTKTLLESAHLLASAGEGRKYGVHISEASLDLGKVMARKTKILKKLSAGIRLGLQEHGVFLVEAEAKLVGRDTEGFHLEAEGVQYTAERVILSTGSHAFVPPVKGLEEHGYLTAREALELKELPSRIAIIGAGVIGMEFASFFSTVGVEVTVVEMLPKILGAMDDEISHELQVALSRKGVHFHLSTKVEEIRDGRILASNADGALEIEVDSILVSVGRRPNIDGLGLEALGVAIERGAVVVDDYMRTNVEGLYAVGDVNGRSMLAHTASRQGVVALEHILGGIEKMNYKAIPGVVYTNPEVASVGKTEQDLRSEGIAYVVHRVPMAMSGRFVIENEMGNGLCKLLTTKEGVLLGVHILGNRSSEILPAAIIAIERGLTVRELASFVFPHPTVCEIVRLAAISQGVLVEP